MISHVMIKMLERIFYKKWWETILSELALQHSWILRNAVLNQNRWFHSE